MLATRNGSSTDAAMWLLDSKGEELAYSDDYYGFKDPHLTYEFKAAGSYLLRVSGSSEAGCDTCDYRLVAGDLPHAYLAMPAGGRRGETVELTLRGVNLDRVKEVTLGDELSEGTVISTNVLRSSRSAAGAEVDRARRIPAAHCRCDAARPVCCV